MAAYCTPDSLELYLGRALTNAESDSATGACLGATAYIDKVLGRSWQSATITGEIQQARDGMIRLDQRPIATVTSVTTRGVYLGASSTVLTSPTGYELINAVEGQLLVNASDGDIVTVSYTVSGGVPADIALAADIIAAAYAVSGSAESGAARGIQKLKAGSAEITYDPIDKAMAIPPRAQEILDTYMPKWTSVTANWDRGFQGGRMPFLTHGRGR